MSKVKSYEEFIEARKEAAAKGLKVVFTNGCFDIVHCGHIAYLRQARALGDLLFVGINSDASVRKLKGAKRPILSQNERAEILAAMEMIDYLTIFDEDTPYRLISTLLPDILVKGGDWQLDQIVGRSEVESSGGKVYSLPYLRGFSTTDIIDRIVARYCKNAI
ncbi:MAG: D-glycero-beta-D-manno-heptose 1-phosphate adenylyltransferase [Acidobacteriota bacterium]|nr:D-glycero-beta-D-manno-heptose 1-phosphate adenylyltransferase [Blastocatellia bacterium]MDW8411500.1 D-glycero-beta-D-manno-heptose 1-phosphate adenylyltransferase [Acidobacteriota bacterium]